MLTIPNRTGPKPKTGAQPPHLQFSDQSPGDIYDALNKWAFETFDLVREERSRISLPSSRALWLDESVPASQNAFMFPRGGREFAHTHADGSLHLVLSEADEKTVLEAGWGELHPLHDRGIKEIMVYAPRNAADLEVVKMIIQASYEHAVASGVNRHSRSHHH
ncbi:luciferase domain-containing protein [Ruegeria arenilitoris]|uniref:luciferase domain-containing protein n=1 Tax=Ruegeria arenilitoris TaxID=1173585 RepID=UPI00147E1A30